MNVDDSLVTHKLLLPKLLRFRLSTTFPTFSPTTKSEKKRADKKGKKQKKKRNIYGK